MHQRDDFDPKTVLRLAERAGYLCANPDCNTITIGPSEANPEAKTNIGRAAHIRAAAINGPRYDSAQEPRERKSINNGIWLCANCADLIDKNKGVDYSPEILRKWKNEHEKMIRHLLRTGNSPLPIIRRKSHEGQIVQQLLEFLDSRGALFVEPPYERNTYVIASLEIIRQKLTSVLHEVDLESPLYSQIRAINEECRKYMNEMSSQDDFELMAIRLLIMRKSIGVMLKHMCQQHALLPPPNLVLIMPK